MIAISREKTLSPIVADRRPPIAALAAVEGVRIVKHPLFLAAILASLAVPALSLRNVAVVLHRDDITVAAALLPVALATFLLANIAASRHRRHHVEDLMLASGMTRARVTRVHLVSIAFPVFAASGVVLVALMTILPLDAVGVPRVSELLVGPASVALAGTLGVAVARWFPATPAGPIAAALLCSIQLSFTVALGDISSAESRMRWLAPWVNLSNVGSPDSELTLRPTWWHVAYLGGIAVVLAVLAVARYRLSARLIVTGAAGAIVVASTTWVQLAPPAPEKVDRIVDLATHPQRYDVCRDIGGVRFCAYPGYRGRVARWSAASAAVLDLIPSAHRPRNLEVRQVLMMTQGSDLPPVVADEVGNGTSFDDARAIFVGTRWARGSAETQYRLAIALPIAERAVGLPAELRLTDADIETLARTYPPPERDAFRSTLRVGQTWTSCHTMGQARAIVALWLAHRSIPGGDAVLRSVASGGLVTRNSETRELEYLGPFIAGGSDVFPRPATQTGVTYARDDVAYAVQLLDKPNAEVVAVLSSRWREVTDRRTSSAELAKVFSLRAPPRLEDRLVEAGMPLERARATRDEDHVNTLPC